MNSYSNISLEKEIKMYINQHFPVAYTIAKLAPVYLVGGAIRDLMFSSIPKDLDFVVLGLEHYDWMMEVLEFYKIEYCKNKMNGYKFSYQNVEIDLWCSSDLFSSLQYNIDGLFFSLETNSFLSVTFDDFVKRGLRMINEENNISNGREEKLIQFQKRFGK